MSGTRYGVRLVGGELIACSDEGPDLPGGQVLRELIERAVPPGAHVLVAGPHGASLVDRLVAHFGRFGRVTCLVRSLPDAEELARRHAGSARLTVVCGALDKLSEAGPERPYDAVIAAGGLGRLGTPDGSPLGWAESLRRLTESMADSGTLVLGLDNELGVHRIVAPDPPDPPDPPGLPGLPGLPGYDVSRVPNGPGELAAALGAAGLTVDRCYAAFPEPALPTVLLPAELLERRLDVHDLPALLISAALSDVPALSDPRRLAACALSSGLGALLAPGWTVVARRTAPPAGRDLPVGLRYEGPGGAMVTSQATAASDAAYWAMTWELAQQGERWVRTAIRPDCRRESGRVVRDPARLAGPVPRGRLLDELLLAACARGDLPELRGLLRSYARWLAGQGAGDDLSGNGNLSGNDDLPGNMVFAETTNVVVADAAVDGAGVAGVAMDGTGGDDRFALLDPSWELTEPLPFRLALARLLRKFALRLVTGGQSHPWPATLDLDGIAVTLLAMAGHPGDRALLGAVVPLEAELTATREALPAADEARLIAELSQGVPRRPLSHRDALHAVRRLTENLHAQRDHAAWLDARLRDAEAALERGKKLERECARRQAELRAVRRSVSFRLGRLITFPVRSLRRCAR